MRFPALRPFWDGSAITRSGDSLLKPFPESVDIVLVAAEPTPTWKARR
jgi:hypothetical protein